MSRFVVLPGLACALLVSACGVQAQDRADVVGVEQLPAGLRPGQAATSPPLRSDIRIYLVGAGGRLAATRVQGSGDTPESAIDALLAVDAPQGGLRNAVLPGTAVRSSELVDGVLAVDVTGEFALVRGRDQLLAVAQIVWTVTEDPRVRRVRIAVDGRYVAVPVEGGLMSEPVARDEYSSVAPP